MARSYIECREDNSLTDSGKRDARELSMILERSSEASVTIDEPDPNSSPLMRSAVASSLNTILSAHNKLLTIGMSVEAKPKKINGVSNYRYHPGVVESIGQQNTYTVRLLQGAVVSDVPRFAIMTSEEIVAQRSKRINDRLRNSEGVNSSTGQEMASVGGRPLATVKVPRQLGNSDDDLRALQVWVK